MPAFPRDAGVDEAVQKADVLIEAMAYIREFRDRITVVKIGGSYMDDAAALRATLQDIVFMETVGMRPVLVHGGGKAINRALAETGREPRFVQGRRYTEPETLAVVARVLDQIHCDIVRAIEDLGGQAASLHYRTTPVLFGEPMRLRDAAGVEHDLGRVGTVTRVDARIIGRLCTAGVVPVIPPIAIDATVESSRMLEERILNINADTTAAAVASALHAEKLVILTDTRGILRDRADPMSWATSVDAAECQTLIDRGIIDAGMIPKVEACLQCLSAGVRKTHMVDGRVRHSLLLEIYTERGIGSEIVPNRNAESIAATPA